MKVCFPVLKASGTDSEVYGHFGSAKNFIIVNTEDQNVTELKNDNEHHREGACDPLKAFKDVEIDSLVVSGIGGGALTKLNSVGMRVFQARALTVKDNLEMLMRNELPEFLLSNTCGGHGGGCAH